jgi:DNA-binding transcriptional LysR family regulator
MNINYLYSFIETVRQDSISKASKTLHLTQSALSQQLQVLEKNLNSTLLIRSNKGVNLTEEGEILLSYAETLVNLYENMIKDLDLCKHSLFEDIKISSCNSVGEYLLPCTLHLYKKTHLKTKIALKNEHTKDVIAHILDCSADIGFIDTNVNIDGMECINISINNLVFIYSSKRQMHNDSISLQDIQKLPLIVGSKGSSLRSLIEDIFAIDNTDGRFSELNIEMELDTIESIKASVIANHGISIIPYASVKVEIHAKVLKTLPISGFSPVCNICMIYRKNKVLQPHIKEFISYIKTYGKETFC